MKAITLTQPWATLVAIGAKSIETRSWKTNYRGRIAIHAAKGLGPVGGKRGLKALCGQRPFCDVLNEYTRNNYLNKSIKYIAENPIMPFGFIVATADLVDVVATEDIASDISFNEREFGDYTAGRYAWLLRNVVKLDTMTEVGGKLGLWEWRE